MFADATRRCSVGSEESERWIIRHKTRTWGTRRERGSERHIYIRIRVDVKKEREGEREREIVQINACQIIDTWNCD